MEAATLGELLGELAARHGDRPAVLGGDEALTFSALDAAAQRWAQALCAAGIGPGQHVGLLCGNRPEWLAIAFGVWRAGATLVPISTFVTPREMAEVLEHADIELLLVQPQLRSQDFVAALRVLPPLPRLRQVVLLADGAGSGFRTRAQLFGGAARGLPDARVHAEDVACILYTSGTTGRPKGVMLSHRAILATVEPTAIRSGLAPGDSLLSTLPLFWVAGLAIRALPTLSCGCALILIETVTTEAILAALRRHLPVALHLRPPQVGQLLAHPDFDPALLRDVCKGNGRAEWYAPHLAPEHARFITGYGMTETAGYVTALDWRDPVALRREGIGTPLPSVELRIVDTEGRVCPPDGEGEVRIRCRGLFSGYYKEASGTGLDGDGFLMTGDLGCLDGSGAFRFLGRSKDLLRSKGINVSPMEIEGILARHPSVEAIYVVGIPSGAIDQELAALIVVKEGGSLPADELRDLARRELSHYKRPQHYLRIEREDVRLGPTSKPQRSALAGLAESRLRGSVAGIA